jgi:uncharacterized protein YjlB
MILNQRNIHVLSYILRVDGFFPNNVLPLIVYKSALELNLTPDKIKKILKNNLWEGCWSGGVYTYHHYHSTAHEVLCVYDGNATLLFGGDKGIVILIKKGDVVIIPAGVAHKNLDASNNFKCIGAYPKGQDYDMKEGKKEEFLKAKKNIAALPLPESDPIFGREGPLLDQWKKRR